MAARWLRPIAALGAAAALGACATPTPYDYTAFKQNRPASLLVLPPVNETTEVIAPLTTRACVVASIV